MQRADREIHESSPNAVMGDVRWANGEGLAGALGVAKLLVGIEFQGDGLCRHARKMHGMGESASASRSGCG